MAVKAMKLDWRSVVNGQVQRAQGVGVHHNWTYTVTKDSPNNWSAWFTDGQGRTEELARGVSHARARAACSDHLNFPSQAWVPVRSAR